MAVQAGRDLDIGHPLGRVEDHPRPLHITPRRRDLPRTTLELLALVSAQLDHVAARPGHDKHFAAPHRPPSHNPKHFRPALLACGDGADARLEAAQQIGDVERELSDLAIIEALPPLR